MRARRRAYRQTSPVAARLNLVSLMDIFTILVFFLLLNSSEIEVLQTAKSVRLPDSHATQKPDPELLISIDADWISLAGQQVLTVSDALAQSEPELKALAIALAEYASVHDAGISNPVTGWRAVDDPRAAITVLGDRGTSYALLKKVIGTCANAGFSQVSLAVNQQPREPSA